MEYLHEFETMAQCSSFIDGEDYKEPFIGLVTENGSVNYNKEPEIDYRSIVLTIEITNGSGVFDLSKSDFDSSTLSYSLNGGEYTNVDDYLFFKCK